MAKMPVGNRTSLQPDISQFRSLSGQISLWDRMCQSGVINYHPASRWPWHISGLHFGITVPSCASKRHSEYVSTHSSHPISASGWLILNKASSFPKMYPSVQTKHQLLYPKLVRISIF